MRERRNFALMNRLLSVQRAKRLAARVAVTEAASAEQLAQATEEEAEETSRLAHREWSAYVEQAGFSPEYCRALAARLIERDSETQQAALDTKNKSDLRQKEQRILQLSEAHVRQTEGSVRKLKRKVKRRDDERRMSELGDRVTYFWGRG